MKIIPKEQSPDKPVIRYWRLSLALGATVIAAVAVLLGIVERAADQIEGGTAEIWRVGKLIANNTVHIPLLVRTNQIVGEISETADGIAGATARIERAVTSQAKK